MRPPLPLPFTLILSVTLALVLAGCASDHSEHGALALNFGVVNESNETIEVGWTVSHNGTVVWTYSAAVEPGRGHERVEPLETQGAHAIALSWGAGHAVELVHDTASCPGTYHWVLDLRADGSTNDRTRECH